MTAFAGIVVQLEAMRQAAGLSLRQMDARIGKPEQERYQSLVQRCSGPILDRISDAARVHGYRLELVPLEGGEEDGHATDDGPAA